MKRFSLNKIRKSIWFGIGFGMTAYFMAGCSDNDSSEYIELAAKITLTQSEYYNNEGETTLHPWTKDDLWLLGNLALENGRTGGETGPVEHSSGGSDHP